MDAPVFLVGAERSRTAWLRAMLDDHPQICWPCDFDFALDWPPARRGEWPDLLDYWGALARSHPARKSRIVIRGDLDFPQLVRSLLGQLAARTHKPVFGVTAHRHFQRIVDLWPDARFVYLADDGPGARSPDAGWAGKAWASLSVGYAAEREWRRLCAGVPSQRRIESSYGTLLRDPQRELARLCGFLGVGFSPAMLERARALHETQDAPGTWSSPEPLSARRVRFARA
jgi:hypothetical protein